MRQAGRYLPEYRALREKHSFLELIANPELAVEVSMQPIRRYGFDGAVIFSDILTPLVSLGYSVSFPNKGGISVEKNSDLPAFDYQKATIEAISLLKNTLSDEGYSASPLGFAGGPWTLAHYILNGGSTRGTDGGLARVIAQINPKETQELLKLLTTSTIEYLKAQIAAGAAAVQIFETHLGELPVDFVRAFIFPELKVLTQALPADCPKILYFGGCAHLLAELAGLGFDVLSLDHRVSLSEAWQLLSQNPKSTVQCLQGNIDPLLMTFRPEQAIPVFQAQREAWQDLPCAQIINLGHGIVPAARVETVEALVRCFREEIK